MRGQRFNHEGTIQQRADTQTVDGEPTGFAWVNLYEGVPAELVPLSGREFLSANAEQAEVTTRCTLPWLEGITTAMRFVHTCCGGLAHNIVAVLPDPSFQRHQTLMLSAGVRDEPVETVTILEGGSPSSDFNDAMDGGSP